jgi:hypothetical protein
VRLRLAALHLGALWSLAVAEPLFDLMRKNPDFLAARGMGSLDIVLFAVVLALGPPLLLVGVEALVQLVSPSAREWLHLVFVALLIALIAVQLLKKLGLDQAAVAVALALLAGAAVAALYRDQAEVRSFFTVLSPAPLVFLFLFLVVGPISDLVIHTGGDVSSARVRGGVPVVMIVFDEVATPALEDARQHIDPVLFPNFAAFARQADWFRDATAPTDETTTAVPALLTGSLPRRGAHPVLSDYPHNLFTFLGGSYRMEVSQEATDLCPRSACRELTRGSLGSRESSLATDTGLVYLHVIAPKTIERNLPSVSDTLGGFASDNGRTKVLAPAAAAQGHTGRVPVLHELAGGRPERFEQLTATIGPSRRPTLYFKHSLLPHVPFQYLPSGRRYQSQPHDAIPGLTDAPSWGNDFLLAQAYQRHLLQLQFADRLLGTVLRRLRDAGLYDKALVVVTADNGESFLHHGNRHEVSRANVEDIAADPLIIKAPGQRRGQIVDRHVRTIDVLPTIAELLRARLPWKVQGQPAWHPNPKIPSQVVVLQRSGRRLTLSLAEFRRRVRASLQRKLALFGSDGHGPGLYGIGPHRELLGHPLDRVRVGAPTPLRAKIDQRNELKSVDFASGFIPAQVSGTITGPGTPGVRDLALAVNGRIEAVAPSFELAGSHNEQFDFIVPESAFHSGDNHVSVLTLRGDVLQPLRQ